MKANLRNATISGGTIEPAASSGDVVLEDVTIRSELTAIIDDQITFTGEIDFFSQLKGAFTSVLEDATVDFNDFDTVDELKLNNSTLSNATVAGLITVVTSTAVNPEYVLNNVRLAAAGIAIADTVKVNVSLTSVFAPSGTVFDIGADSTISLTNALQVPEGATSALTIKGDGFFDGGATVISSSALTLGAGSTVKANLRNATISGGTIVQASGAGEMVIEDSTLNSSFTISVVVDVSLTRVNVVGDLTLNATAVDVTVSDVTVASTATIIVTLDANIVRSTASDLVASGGDVTITVASGEPLSINGVSTLSSDGTLDEAGVIE